MNGSGKNTTKGTSGKWLDVADPDVPAGGVARQAIEDRLLIVLAQMKQTAARNRPSAEDIHQLRVATRRATAALDTFAEFVPSKRRRRLRRRLRKIRQAASTIRDLDIVAASNRASEANLEEADDRQVQRQIARYRHQEQQTVARLICKRRRLRLRRESKQLIKRVAWRSSAVEPSFAEAARTALKPVVLDFFRSAAHCQWDPPSLHRLRISAKRLRYAIELLRSAFDKSAVKAIYPEIEEIQQRLGDLNDRAMTRASYERWQAETDAPDQARHYQELIAIEDARLLAEIESFRTWWSPARQAGMQQRFANLDLAADAIRTGTAIEA